MDVYQQYSADTLHSNSLGDLNYEHSEFVEEEVRNLFAAHGADIYFGKRHPSPCTTWRSERIQLDRETLPRFANRVHIFEKNPDAQAGRYLGYVTLRPLDRKYQSYYQYVAVANIAPPRFMLRPRYHLISCVGGPPDGVLPFRCTPFCFPFNDIRWQASCLHTALQQALLLKMNSFNLTPISSQEIIARLWSLNQTRAPQSTRQRKGATLAQGLQALRDEQDKPVGVLETIPLRDFALTGEKRRWFEATDIAKAWVYLEAHRCMTDYLSNGLPLIIELLDPQAQYSHAVLVFGMHLLHDPADPAYVSLTAQYPKTRVDIAELPGRFVLHDIIEGPFVERQVARLLESSWSVDAADEGRNSISFLAIVPPGTRLGIYDARKLARELAQRHPAALWQQYLEDYFPRAENIGRPTNVDSVRYVTRLLQSRQVEQRYFTGTQYSRKNKLPAHLETWRRHSQGCGYWWCVEVGVAEGNRFQTADKDADKDALALIPPPALVYLWCVEDTLKSPPRGQLTYIGGKTRPQMRLALHHPQTGEQRSMTYAYRPQRP